MVLLYEYLVVIPKFTGLNTYEKGTKRAGMIRSLCKNCGERPVAINYRKEGKTFYRSKCDHCSRGNNLGKAKWELAGYKKKDTCDRCSYTGKYLEQFNVYYVDGDPTNCRFSNLKTVCANCQRILHKLKLPWKRGDLRPDF
jgi:hypothetical protein